jgi:hypothetical protein
MLARALVAVSVLALLLSGCASKTAAPATGALPSTGPGAMTGMDANHAMAPQWKVGQWWDHHWYFGPQDTTGFMVKSIVVSNGTDGMRLATDDPLDAASHSSFYFHDQGVMGPDWSVRDFGGAFQFPWYSFPLKDGKTWTAHEENLDFNLQKVSRDLTLKATAINGTMGAFMIEASTAEGLRARYDYQPSIGWFSEYRAYDPANPDPTQYNARMVNEKQGQSWTGTYYIAKADFLLNAQSVFVPAAGVVQPSTQPTFTVTPDHTNVMAIPFAFAQAGGANTELVAPDGRHWESYTTGFADGSPGPLQNQPGLVFVPAAVGDWHCATVGAGVLVWGGGCFAWGVTMTSATL